MFEMLSGGKSRKKKKTDKELYQYTHTQSLPTDFQIHPTKVQQQQQQHSMKHFFCLRQACFQVSACAFMATATNTCALLIRSMPTSFCKKSVFFHQKYSVA